jgi:hypothetical protein
MTAVASRAYVWKGTGVDDDVSGVGGRQHMQL